MQLLPMRAFVLCNIHHYIHMYMRCKATRGQFSQLKTQEHIEEKFKICLVYIFSYVHTYIYTDASYRAHSFSF